MYTATSRTTRRVCSRASSSSSSGCCWLNDIVFLSGFCLCDGTVGSFREFANDGKGMYQYDNIKGAQGEKERERDVGLKGSA